jgi:hypothetical protein
MPIPIACKICSPETAIRLRPNPPSLPTTLRGTRLSKQIDGAAAA